MADRNRHKYRDKTMKKGLIYSTALIALVFAYQASSEQTDVYIPDGYAIETIDTPNKARFHITGLDIDNNGDVYVATRFGDVWRLQGSNWLKAADGFHEPTGLLVDDDGSLLVAQKPELTRLVDVDNDGVFDEYINLADDWSFHDNYHEFNFGPVKDSDGNLYGTLNLGHGSPNELKLGAMGSSGGYRGWAYKIDKHGKFVPFASGLRSPAGIGISPDDQVFFTDNQGDWVETSKLHLLEFGKFYGHPVSLRDHPDFDVEKILSKQKDFDYWDKMREKPVVWIPHVEVANSPGNPEWDVTQGKFGPFAGQMFIADLTQSSLFRVILEEVNGQLQGAVVNFANGFQSGNIRIKFDMTGQLWVGQTARGWGAKGDKPFGLQKVTWDGTNPFELLDMKLNTQGFDVTFTEALDSESVNNADFSLSSWSYKYSSAYGSPKTNQQDLNISSLSLLDDRRTIRISLASPLQTNTVVALSFEKLKDQDGRTPTTTKAYYTINKLLK
ncbi:hypothetical protein [Agaribacter flavus]|uniref:Glucose/Sorbosone dehydrogenase domain-containing protein n=1 Tax=Agaribacter flavus TaxID=1902781 RepID=A0ABV7FTG3_9ALTE